MNRSINLALNNFPTTPNSLRADPAIDEPKDTCRCDLARLFHHYYIDTYGRRPPKPDLAQFEYIDFIANCDDFRFVGDGIGASTSSRRNTSTALGQAFCRWFLHEHLSITYFAHIDKVLNRSLHRGFGNLRLVRKRKGDVPDYVCAKNVNRIYLAEAKGRYSSVSFANREFEKWRKQFSRVEILDGTQPLSVKGFIVGTRFVTEENQPTLKSGIFAEDPKSPGERSLSDNSAGAIGSVIVAEHYTSIFQKLDQTLIATALASGTTVPEQLQLKATAWQFQLDILEGMRFIGGYWPPLKGTLPFTIENNQIVTQSGDPFRLDTGRGTFFGLEENIFRQVVAMARFGLHQAAEVQTIDDIAPFYSAISLLRDGSIIGPAELFIPIDLITV